MRRIILSLLSILLLALPMIQATAQEEAPAMTEGPIFEIAIRRIVNQEEWAKLNAELNAVVAEFDGFVGSREYITFFGIPEIEEGQVYTVSISEWESLDAYMATSSLLEDPLVLAYFETIESVQNVIVQPFVKGEELHLGDLGASGQVLELAVRDISGYEDQVDFFRSIRGFTHQLTSLDGVVREFEWMSIDGQYFVGMTLYESMEAFNIAAQNEDLLGSPLTTALFTQYPPLVAQITSPRE